MFSQNVVEPREFITEPGDSIWDSQANSQAWGNSQTSNSVFGIMGDNSQNGYRNNNEFQCRTWRSSNGSDYWSQSQNQSTQPLQESSDGSKYHLKYLNRPAMFGAREGSRFDEDKKQNKNFQNYVELQRKKSFDQETRNRLDQIIKTLNEYSEEVCSNINTFKSDLTQEMVGISEKWHKEAEEVKGKFEKYAEEMTQHLDLLKNFFSDAQENASNEFKNLHTKLESLKQQNEDILTYLESENENKKIEIDKKEIRAERTEKTLQEILSHVEKRKVLMSESSIQTVPAITQDETTQCIKSETCFQETQTEGDCVSGPFEEYKQNILCESYHQHNILNQSGYYRMCQTEDLSRSQNAMQGSQLLSSTVMKTCGKNAHPASELRFIQPNTVKPTASLQYQQVVPKEQPLSIRLTGERLINFSEGDCSSPVATVAPMLRSPGIKQEVISPCDDLEYSIRRKRTKRPTQAGKKEDPSSIFMFEICSDEDDSGEMTMQKEQSNVSMQDILNVSTNEQCNVPKNGPSSVPTKHTSHLKQTGILNSNKELSKTRNTAVQKEITSYGKMKKNTSYEWMKKSPFWKSPSTIGPTKAATKHQVKDKSGMTSRGSLAQKRKEYAESVFCFDDFADLKQLQLQFQTSVSSKKQSR